MNNLLLKKAFKTEIKIMRDLRVYQVLQVPEKEERRVKRQLVAWSSPHVAGGGSELSLREPEKGALVHKTTGQSSWGFLLGESRSLH